MKVELRVESRRGSSVGEEYPVVRALFVFRNFWVLHVEILHGSMVHGEASKIWPNNFHRGRVTNREIGSE